MTIGNIGDRSQRAQITEVLRMDKNATLQVQKQNGDYVEITLDELKRLSAANRYETLAAAKTLVAADSGKTYFLALAGGFTVTLPAPAVGLNFEFVVAVDPTTAYIIVTNGGADIMKGLIQESETDTTEDGPTDQDADTLNLVASVAVAGDFVRMRSDGTSWFYEGQTAADGGVTTSTT